MATVILPETVLKNMIAETQTWRAIVANPDADWATIEPLITAGGIAEGDAAAAIVIGRFEERPDAVDYVGRPRINCVQFDDDDLEITGGISRNGTILAEVELRIPADYVGRAGKAVEDGRLKMESLIVELLSLPRQGGRLASTGGTLGPVDLSSDEEDIITNRFLVADFMVRWRGGVCVS